MSEDCLFDKIIDGEIPSDKVYEDDEILAFKDVQPTAPVHILIIPKKHIPAVSEMDQEDTQLIGKLFWVAKKLAEKEGIDSDGYRLVINNGDNGGQHVHHIHLHLIGGRKMAWPPG